MSINTPEKPPSDELIKSYKTLKFPSGDLDDLIFGTVELKESQKQPKINPEVQK